MKRRIVIPDATLVQEFVYTQQQLPTHKPIVQYIRQSTTKQLKRNKQSYELQDSDLRRKLTRGYGWPDNNEFIIKVDSDQGKSGTKRRDERSGLDYLYTLLEQDLAGAVAAFDVSRLYRVLSRAEYGAFCDMVLERKIPVVTFNRIYWPTQVDNDQLNDDFRAAAMFIEDIIKGKLLAAKYRHIQYDVSYAGNAVPFGYVVLDMGNETADRKFYTIYKPHASLIRWLFKRFRELGGNLPLLGRELAQTNFAFPPFDAGIPVHVALTASADGSYPLRTRAALISILTNKAYIGYYEYAGVLVSREAHEPIVSMDDFIYAYERLSGTTLDGEVQERKPRERRYSATTALLDGVVRSGDLPVYVIRGKYEAKDDANGFTRTELAIPVDMLDKPFSQALITLLATLELKKADSELNKQVKQLQQEQTKRASEYSKGLARIEREIANAEMAKRVSQEEGDEQGYRDATKQLVQLRKDRLALEAKAEEASSEAGLLSECYNLIECAVNDWKGMSTEKRKRLVKLAVSSANVSAISQHFLQLDIALSAPIDRTFTVYLYRARGSRVLWIEQEDSVLTQLLPTASKQEVMQALPTHSWLSIVQRGRNKLGVSRKANNNDTLTYADMLVMQETGARVDKPVWVFDEQTNRHVGILARFQGVDLEQVRVLLYELPPEHWAVGGQTKAMQQSAIAQQQNEADE